jgi:carboxymethylenebutenolidase
MRGAIRRRACGAFAMVLVACAGGGNGHEKETATPPAAPPGAVGASPSEVPGGLSEEEFARLHELRPDAAPPRKGQLIEVGGARAYLSLPEGAKAPLPGVIVIHEWWGLNEHIMHWADRLAADGYAALAVDLYGGVVATTREDALAAVKKVDDAQARAIIVAAHRFLVDDPRVKAPRTASIGWCFGGGWSMQAAIALPDLDAAVIYYGHVPTDAKAFAGVKAHVLGIFGNQDEGIPPKHVDAFDAALTAAGVQHRILRYDAPHAFANPSQPSYHPKEAAAAWAETRAFLRAELKPETGKQL